MNASGLTLALLGVVAVAQVLRGAALQRLGILPCPQSSTPPKGGGGTPYTGSGGGASNGNGVLPPQIPPRFSG